MTGTGVVITTAETTEDATEVETEIGTVAVTNGGLGLGLGLVHVPLHRAQIAVVVVVVAAKHWSAFRDQKTLVSPGQALRVAVEAKVRKEVVTPLPLKVPNSLLPPRLQPLPLPLPQMLSAVADGMSPRTKWTNQHQESFLQSLLAAT